ncbi:hypothetical protein CHS0354_006589 [Potamilus streckersoni]|uniref:Uncharacterized protein n=1 Tax=Potamilus streckersoni TaxID=2493646 RepID=A0AAE0SXM5_9BIVA|nr:hypothetical protein CHS0354_006589 [Potamilus streckersoni]
MITLERTEATAGVQGRTEAASLISTPRKNHWTHRGPKRTIAQVAKSGALQVCHEGQHCGYLQPTGRYFRPERCGLIPDIVSSLKDPSFSAERSLSGVGNTFNRRQPEETIRNVDDTTRPDNAAKYCNSKTNPKMQINMMFTMMWSRKPMSVIQEAAEKLSQRYRRASKSSHH